jgi:hypothetical protein
MISLLRIQLHEITSVHPMSVAILKTKIAVRRRRGKDYGVSWDRYVASHHMLLLRRKSRGRPLV